MIEIRKNIGNFGQKVGENYPQAWDRFFEMINSIPNHGYSESTVCHLSYHGFNTQCKEMLDLSAGGSINSLTAKACLELMSTRAMNDSLYNPDLGTKPDRGILYITPDLMPEVHKTMKEKGIPSELVKQNNVDLLQIFTKEDETRKVFQQLKH